MPIRELLEEALKEPSIGNTSRFSWHATPVGIAALLKMTGPVSVTSFKEPITSANAVDFLTRRQYLELANDERIDLLAEVGVATFERLLAGTT
ncbi:MAG: hypothetical protein WCH37_04575, partial [Synechococcaceae cyanobacterium ELA182]